MGHGNWNLTTLSFNLPKHVRSIIQTVSLLPSGNSSPNGSFDVRSAYLLPSSSTSTPSPHSWKWLWRTPTIPRVRTFLWLACHDRLQSPNQGPTPQKTYHSRCVPPTLPFERQNHTPYSQRLPRCQTHLELALK